MSQLLKDINDAANHPEALSEQERSELLAATEKLRNAFENPLDATLRICFSVSANLGPILHPTTSMLSCSNLSLWYRRPFVSALTWESLMLRQLPKMTESQLSIWLRKLGTTPC
jgi:hypothetical protein